MLNRQIDSLTSLPYRRVFEKRYVQHIIFWTGYLAFFFFIQFTVRPDDFLLKDILIIEAVNFFGMIVIVYINLEILIPQILEKRKYLLYVIILLSVMFTIAFLAVKLNDILPFSVGFHRPRLHKRGPGTFIVMIMSMQMFFVVLTSFLHYLKQTIRLRDMELQLKELESINYRTELDSLKAQINPHFLFNTLNNIYSHSLLEKDQVPDMLLKLSDLMHYILYECREEKVPLSKDIKFISNYIDLEKVRVDESFKININIQDVENRFQIAPLLFITFLENAFKHGVNIEKGNPFINVDLKIVDDTVLDFFVENSSSEGNYDSDSQGIGLENVKKRLELIYPDKHQLDISNKNGKFRVNLIIELD